jgi:hypothetical protein
MIDGFSLPLLFLAYCPSPSSQKLVTETKTAKGIDQLEGSLFQEPSMR